MEQSVPASNEGGLSRSWSAPRGWESSPALRPKVDGHSQLLSVAEDGEEEEEDMKAHTTESRTKVEQLLENESEAPIAERYLSELSVTFIGLYLVLVICTIILLALDQDVMDVGGGASSTHDVFTVGALIARGVEGLLLPSWFRTMQRSATSVHRVPGSHGRIGSVAALYREAAADAGFIACVVSSSWSRLNLAARDQHPDVSVGPRCAQGLTLTSFRAASTAVSLRASGEAMRRQGLFASGDGAHSLDPLGVADCFLLGFALLALLPRVARRQWCSALPHCVLVFYPMPASVRIHVSVH